MKTIFKFFILSIFLFGLTIFGLYSYITSSSGKGHIEGLISQKIYDAINIEIEFESFEFDYKSFSFVAVDKLDGGFSAKVFGTYSFYPKLVEAKYNITIPSLGHYKDLLGAKIDAPLEIAGDVVKANKDIDLRGVAKIYGGEVEYEAYLFDFEPKSFKSTGDNFNTLEITDSLDLPHLVDGSLNFKFDGDIENKTLKRGDFELASIDLVLNSRFLEESYDVRIKDEGMIALNALGEIENWIIEGGLELTSSFLDISIPFLKYDIPSQNIETSLKFLVENLNVASFDFEDNTKGVLNLKGNPKGYELYLDGEVLKTPFELEVLFDKKSIENLKASSSIDIDRILEYSAHKNLASGKLSIDADMQNINSLQSSGFLNIASNGIEISKDNIKEAFDIELPKNLNIEIKGDISLEGGVARGNMALIENSDYMKLDSIYVDLVDKSYSSDIQIDIENLKSLNPFKEHNFNGELLANGKFNIDKNSTYLELHSQSFGGNLESIYENSKLQLLAKELDIVKILKMSDQKLPINGGKLDLNALIFLDSKDINSSYGDILLAGRDIELAGYDMDKIIKSFKKSNSFDLFDVGAFALGGPLGLVAMKASDIGGLGLEATKKGKTTIELLNSELKIDEDSIKFVDVAFRTGENRVAFVGGIDKEGLKFRDFQVALLQKNGCAEFVQDINGTIFEPKIETTKHILSLPFNLVSSIVKSTVGVIVGDKNCVKFYDGVVEHK